VSLTGISHTYPDDLDVLLVGPAGQKVLLMSDAGGGTDINNATLTFDDAAASTLPDASAIVSGTYKPTDFGTGDIFPSPAPGGPYGTTLSAFNGLNPNGTWSLYVLDDAASDSGGIAGGWSLKFTY
jgi:subtilisin-like proprotein convertase family protein